MLDMQTILLRIQKLNNIIQHKKNTTGKVDINFCDIHGFSLLHYAIMSGDIKEIESLLQKGAKLNLDADALTIKPIELALKYNKDVAKYLFDRGADCTKVLLSHASDPACYEWFRQEIKKALNESFPLQTTSANDKYFQINKENQFFKKITFDALTFLHRAVEIGEMEYLDRLDSPFFSDQLSHFEEKGPQLLNLAVVNNQFDMLNRLYTSMQALPKIVIQKQYAESALHVAVRTNNLGMIKSLLELGADIEHECIRMQTPLMLSIELGNLKATRLLIENNASLRLANWDDNNVFHLAVTSGNLELLSKLLEQHNDVSSLLSQQNLYGETPLGLAYRLQNNAIIEKLKVYTNELGAELKQFDVTVNQQPILDKLYYYLSLHDRDTKLFSIIGCCNGFSFLFQYYSAKGMEDYYFQTLALINRWDGDLETLYKPWTDIPQAKYYKNLGELLEQWCNDIIWFQEFRTDHTRIEPDNRVEQYAIIGADSNYNPHVLFEQKSTPGSPDFTETQIKELTHYFTHMPVNTRFMIVGGKHATSAYIDKDRIIKYYDCNFSYRIRDIMDVDDFVCILINTKYIRTGQFTSLKKIPFGFQFLRFNKDEILFDPDQFHPFDQKDYPKSTEEANLHHKHSPNWYTSYHVAIMMRSLPALRHLLETNICNINAKDICGNSPLEMAYETNFLPAIPLLLENDKIIINNPRFVADAYSKKMHKLVDTIIEHPHVINLNYLFSAAANVQDLELAKRLLSMNKVNILACGRFNQSILEELSGYQSDFIDLILNVLTEMDINQVDYKNNNILHYIFDKLDLENNLRLLKFALNQQVRLDVPLADSLTALDTITGRIRSIQGKPVKELNAIALILDAPHFNPGQDEQHLRFLEKLASIAITKDLPVLLNMILAKYSKFIINTYNKHGLTLLHKAVNKDNFEMCKTLVQSGADVNLPTRTQSKNTCMHMVLIKEYPQAYIDFFMTQNARLDLKNGDGKTAEDYMSESNRTFIDCSSEGSFKQIQ